MTFYIMVQKMETMWLEKSNTDMRIQTFLALIMFCVLMGAATRLHADEPEVVPDDKLLETAVSTSEGDWDEGKRLHYPKVVLFQRGLEPNKEVAMQVVLANHTRVADNHIEGFRVYQGKDLLCKFLLTEEVVGHEFTLYFNAQKYPPGTTFTLVVNCVKDGPFKREVSY